MSNSWLKSTAGKLLLTEGDSDCHVIVSLCSYYKLEAELFGFFSCGNDDQVLKKANALLNLDGENKKEVIGIVLDADRDLSACWQRVKDKFSRYQYTFPDRPTEGGTILEADLLPKLGVWLMPNNIDVGMLEDFCLQLVDLNKVTLVEENIQLAKEKNITSFKEVHSSKALIHTYLAWQDEPGKPLGQAITAKILEPDHLIAKEFKNWLIKLFSD